MIQATAKLHDCDNCEAERSDADLEPTSSLSSRIDPGGTVPSGRCPDCGSLCYPSRRVAANELSEHPQAIRSALGSRQRRNQHRLKRPGLIMPDTVHEAAARNAT
jgi:hypothetical protein